MIFLFLKQKTTKNIIFFNFKRAHAAIYDFLRRDTIEEVRSRVKKHISIYFESKTFIDQKIGRGSKKDPLKGDVLINHTF